jgi:hypothetical protein
MCATFYYTWYCLRKLFSAMQCLVVTLWTEFSVVHLVVCTLEYNILILCEIVCPLEYHLQIQITLLYAIVWPKWLYMCDQIDVNPWPK